MNEGQFNEMILALEKCLKHLELSSDVKEYPVNFLSEPERLRARARQIEEKDSDISFAREVFLRNKNAI